MENLRDVNPVSAFFMSEASINDYVFRLDRSDISLAEQYDIGLILGCHIDSVMESRMNEAIKLYYNEVIDKLLLTGGIGYLSMNRDETEASRMRKYMLKNGVCDSDIIVEDKSRNTLENMKNSLVSIEMDVNKPSLVLVTSDFHCKRAKGMLSKMTTLPVYAHGSLDGIYDIDTWNKQGLGVKKMIRTEAALLSWYTMNKTIDNQAIEHDVLARRRHR